MVTRIVQTTEFVTIQGVMHQCSYIPDENDKLDDKNSIFSSLTGRDSRKPSGV